jgi:hypothetical protein
MFSSITAVQSATHYKTPINREGTHIVLFKQVTGIRSPFRHGLTSSAVSARAPLKEKKKANVAANTAEERAILNRTGRDCEK